LKFEASPPPPTFNTLSEIVVIVLLKVKKYRKIPRTPKQLQFQRKFSFFFKFAVFLATTGLTAGYLVVAPHPVTSASLFAA
jgi:hypothetical protein